MYVPLLTFLHSTPGGISPIKTSLNFSKHVVFLVSELIDSSMTGNTSRFDHGADNELSVRSARPGPEVADLTVNKNAT